MTASINRMLGMKAIFALIAALCFATAYMSWIISKPLVARNGTAVIAAKEPGVKGGKKHTVLLPKDLTMAQMSLLNFAYKVAVEDGIKHPEYLQGVLMQETLAGAMKSFRVAGHELGNKADNLYYGVTQIKLKAAKDVMAKWPEMWKYLQTKTDQELMARLIVDDQFNIRIGSKYLLMMGINENKDRAAAAYNRGPTGVLALENPSTFHYTEGVKKHAKRVNSLGVRGQP